MPYNSTSYEQKMLLLQSIMTRLCRTFGSNSDEFLKTKQEYISLCERHQNECTRHISTRMSQNLKTSI